MATSVEIGRGYVTLFVKDNDYHKAMAKAETRLKGMGAIASNAFKGGLPGVATATTRFATFTTATNNATRAMQAATKSSAALNTAMKGGSAGGIAATVKAVGQAQASVLRAQNQGQAQAIRAQGQRAATVVRGVGSAVGTTIRASGSAASGVIRSLAMPIKAITAPLTAAVSGASRLGSSLGKLGLLGGGLGGAGVLGYAASQASAAEDRMASLRRITGMANGDVERLRSQLEGVAKTTPGVRTGDVFGIASMGAKLGIESSGLVKFTRDISAFKLALGDSLPIEQATESVARLQNIFGAGEGPTRSFASALVGLDNASTASAADILDITTRLAPMAKRLGLSASESMGLAAALREAGVSAEVSGSSLTTLLGRMAEASKRPAFAKIAGMQSRVFEDLVRRSPLQAIQAVAKGIEQKDKLKAVDALNGLGLEGVRSRTSLLALAATQGKLAEFVKRSNLEFRTQESLTRSVGIQGETTSAQLGLLRNQLEILAGEAGRALLPVLKGLGRGLAEFSDSIRAKFEANREMFVRWGERTGETIRRVGVLWTNFPDFVALASIRGQEKLLQFKEVVSRTADYLGAAFVASGKFLMATLPQVFDNIGARFENAMKNAASNIVADMRPLLGLLFDEGQLEKMTGLNVRRKIPKVDFERPAFNFMGDMFKAGQKFNLENLPSLDAQAKPFSDRIAKARADADANAEKRKAEATDEDRLEALGFAHRKRHGSGAFLPPSLQPGASSEPRNLIEANRAQRLRANAAWREQRDAFNAMMRGGRRRVSAHHPSGSNPVGLATEPQGDHQAKNDAMKSIRATDRSIGALEILATKLDQLSERINVLQRDGMPTRLYA